ncbi:hypothetical protein C4M83_01620 [Mycoplasmopsis pullorum]|nr:hypothetical protein C4M83_01620 [Mycoplasmopsis pullorum]
MELEVRPFFCDSIKVFKSSAAALWESFQLFSLVTLIAETKTNDDVIIPPPKERKIFLLFFILIHIPPIYIYIYIYIYIITLLYKSEIFVYNVQLSIFKILFLFLF